MSVSYDSVSKNAAILICWSVALEQCWGKNGGVSTFMNSNINHHILRHKSYSSPSNITSSQSLTPVFSTSPTPVVKTSPTPVISTSPTPVVSTSPTESVATYFACYGTPGPWLAVISPRKIDFVPKTPNIHFTPGLHTEF